MSSTTERHDPMSSPTPEDVRDCGDDCTPEPNGPGGAVMGDMFPPEPRAGRWPGRDGGDEQPDNRA